MRIVVDTNVLMSGIFFGGVPGRILAAWREERFELAVSPDIADEYVRAGERPAQRFAGVDVRIILDLVVRNAEVVPNTVLPEPVCDDPDDDKFLACALAARADLTVSGDKKLLAVSATGTSWSPRLGSSRTDGSDPRTRRHEPQSGPDEKCGLPGRCLKPELLSGH